MKQYYDTGIPDIFLKNGYSEQDNKLVIQSQVRLDRAILKSLLYVERRLRLPELVFINANSPLSLQEILQIDSFASEKVLAGSDNLMFSEEFMYRKYVSDVLNMPIRSDHLHRAIRSSRLPTAMYFEMRNFCWKRAVE